ncbi:pleckstrin homology domain-containing family G member 5-like, partial [Limulus polyphemus]|uniref:Pleckstrin homology domain-containing family G member 5-like n=1 Tax=Limulus polyphemus TaxID=6850 RepID=A0ABM1C2W1_LIMPO
MQWSEVINGFVLLLQGMQWSEVINGFVLLLQGMQWSEVICQFEQEHQEPRSRSDPPSSTIWSSTSSVSTLPPSRSDLRHGFCESEQLLTSSMSSGWGSGFGSSHWLGSTLSSSESNQLQLRVGNSASEQQLVKSSPEISPYRSVQESSDVTSSYSYEVAVSSSGSETNDTFLTVAYEELRTSILTKGELRRREALWDLFQSEVMFLYDHLMVLKNVFMEPLKKIQVEGYVMFAQPEVLFGNLDELCCVTYAFCKEFIHLILQNTRCSETETTEVLVKLFQKSSKATALRQAYHRYTINYINALNYLETLRRQVEFNEFEKWCSRDLRCKKLQLTDLLVSPVQHIMRVPLLLKEIEMRTDDEQEKDVIINIVELEENSLRELDDKMKWLKNFERLLEIQRNIIWPSITELDPKVFIPE